MTQTATEQLLEFRKSIDNLDDALIRILAERFRITKAWGVGKEKSWWPPGDPAREKQQAERLRALAVDADLDPDFAETLLRFIIDEVMRKNEKARK